jgi:hypothetical protein
MRVKKIESDEIRILIKAIRELADKAKEEKEEKFSSISSKDVLFYFLTQISVLDNRITRVETTQKLSFWFIGISISIIGLILVIVK